MQKLAQNAESFSLVLARSHTLDPSLFRKIPFDRLVQASGDRHLRLPAKLVSNFARVDSIPIIVPRSIGNELNRLSTGSARTI